MRSQKKSPPSPHTHGEPWVAKAKSVPVIFDPETGLELPLSEKYQPWQVWAEVTGEGESVSLLTGQYVYEGNSWPILTIHKSNAVDVPHLNQRNLAERICACVNFCAGVATADLVGGKLVTS